MTKLAELAAAAAVVVVVVAVMAATTATTPTMASPWTNYDKRCIAKTGMSMAQCRLLESFWINSDVCLYYPGLSPQVRAKFAPFVAWVGSACPTPCAVSARKAGRNPKVRFRRDAASTYEY